MSGDPTAADAETCSACHRTAAEARDLLLLDGLCSSCWVARGQARDLAALVDERAVAEDLVASCTRCPFALVAGSRHAPHVECAHPAIAPPPSTSAKPRAVSGALATASVPPWCPLRRGPILVRLCLPGEAV